MTEWQLDCASPPGSLREKASRLVREVAGARWTTASFLLLIAGVLLIKVADVSPTWALLLPMSTLAANLGCALSVNPALSRSRGLFLFHFGLLVSLVLASSSRLTYLDGRVEVVEGGLFQGKLDRFVSGPLHPQGVEQVAFVQGRFEVPHHENARRGAIRSDVVWIDRDGTRREGVFSEQRPLVVGGYRFTPTSNKGFAAIFEWRDRAGRTTLGTVHFPSYPQNRFRQSAEWKLPGSAAPVWALLEFEPPRAGADGIVWFDVPSPHRLVLRTGDARWPVGPGQSVRLGGGTLTYLGLRPWLGYRVFYDVVAPWLLASAIVSAAGLAWHLIWGRRIGATGRRDRP